MHAVPEAAVLAEAAVFAGCSISGLGAIFWDRSAATYAMACGGSVWLHAASEAAVLTEVAVLAGCSISGLDAIFWDSGAVTDVPTCSGSVWSPEAAVFGRSSRFGWLFYFGPGRAILELRCCYRRADLSWLCVVACCIRSSRFGKSSRFGWMLYFRHERGILRL